MYRKIQKTLSETQQMSSFLKLDETEILAKEEREFSSSVKWVPLVSAGLACQELVEEYRTSSLGVRPDNEHTL